MAYLPLRGLLTFLILLVLLGSVNAGIPGGTVVQTDEKVPFIVVLKDQPERGTTFSTMKAEAAASQASVLSSISAIDCAAARSAERFWIVNAIRVEVDQATIEKIAALPGVDHVEPDLMVMADDPVTGTSHIVDARYVRSSDTFVMPWNLDWVEAPAVWGAGNQGEGVTIAVVDTGIDASHPAFGGRVRAFADFVNVSNTLARDDNGHGTHCAGTAAGGEVTVSRNNGGDMNLVLGVAPKADLIGAKVLDSTAVGPTSTIIKGVQWAVENDADVLSLSVGSYFWKSDMRPNENDESYLAIGPGETLTLTLEVSSNYGGGADVYEPQFVVGGYELEQMGQYYAAAPYAPTPANLTFSLTAPNGVTPVGGFIDWGGFDHSSSRVMFKAPYTSNSGNWNGFWTLNVTNNDNETVYLEQAAIAEAYESDGNTAFDLTLNNLVEGGVVAVVAAGNDGYFGTGTIGTPGTAADVITVGATDYCMDYRASFSSIGPVNQANPYVKPDVMAPGVGVLSACPDGQYGVMDGTSMATPCVAGTAALMLAGNDTLTPAEVKQTLMDTAVHIREDGTAMATPELNNLYGAGRISAYRAVEATGGLHGAPEAASSLTELFGGPYYDLNDPNTVEVLGVCWNATAGVPVAGETVNFSLYLYENSNWNIYRTQSAFTDADGMATTSFDISTLAAGRSFKAEVTWGDRVLSGSYGKYSTPGSGGTNTPSAPIYEAQSFIAPPDGAVTIRYPLLNIDGSAYTEPVRLVVANTTTTFFDDNLTPVDGVVTATVDFAGFNIDPSLYWTRPRITINGRSAGTVSFSYEVYYGAISSPRLAICPPGSSIDIALQVAERHGNGGTVTSKDYKVDVTAFTETQILSLSPDLIGQFAIGAPIGGAALLEAAGGLKPVESTGMVSVTNGIGIYNFTMPAGCSVAVVSFADPDNEYNERDSFMISVVYGSMSPWTLHRVTPPVPVALEALDSTYIGISDYAWPATWNQSEYRSVPGDQATLTAFVLTVNGTTYDVTRDAGKTVRLYTADGVRTNTTDVNGTCTFTLDVTGKTSEDVILLTEGIDFSAGIFPYIPFEIDSKSRIYPGLLECEPGTAAALTTLRPASETRWMDVTYPGSGSYQVSLHSYGPDDTPITERGIFTASPCADWCTQGTEFADTFAYIGDWTKTITPAMNGTYVAHASVLRGGKFVDWIGQMFSVPEAHVNYTVKPDILVGSTVPVTFTVADDDGNPISNAKVGFLLGAAAQANCGVDCYDIRPINLEHLEMEYPDPYSEVLVGYTDANGQVILNIHAPSAGMAIERNLLGFSDYVPYRTVCYKGDEVIKGCMEFEMELDMQYYDGTFRLTAEPLPDFVPGVRAPHVVKVHRDDTIVVDNLYLDITNQGTADFVHTDTDIVVKASVGNRDQSTTYAGNIAVGETKTVLHLGFEAAASDYGIDTSNYNLPVDMNIDVTVNQDRTIAEVSYANNNIVYPVRITAPDLVAEINVPSVVIESGTPTPVALVVTNQGEVPAVATTMTYVTTGSPAETIAVPALGAGESCTVWRNRTFLTDPGAYTLNFEVNSNGATDYETTFANNKVTRTVNCYLHPLTSVVLPQDLVLVPGTTYDLPIVVNGAENLSACLMTFTFDPAAFTVTDVTPGAIPLIAENLKTPGEAIFEADAPTGVSGDVTVATLHLSVTGSSGTMSALHLDAELSDENEYSIPVEVTQGSAVLLLYGDANDDGKVNQADTLRVLKVVVGLPTAPMPATGTTPFLQADVHKNSVIEVGDAMFIAQKNVGLRDPYFRIV
ncbi:hypothetical protein RJ40_08895 [Methanofollis aquaemaris]|uniref:Dockerin domain-containing protein n=1 Tax=Methanofollis aquaemaris TaxID=126734 RepID=A0A8A3S7F8_9EURY|nr:S8 family serine peptidase [Methanofollis aquaemaris]QSZ67614.1 hypothetical protein RJ40_08895 [Methanofollis aquaemaris]